MLVQLLDGAILEIKAETEDVGISYGTAELISKDPVQGTQHRKHRHNSDQYLMGRHTIPPFFILIHRTPIPQVRPIQTAPRAAPKHSAL